MEPKSLRTDDDVKRMTPPEAATRLREMFETFGEYGLAAEQTCAMAPPWVWAFWVAWWDGFVCRRKLARMATDPYFLTPDMVGHWFRNGGWKVLIRDGEDLFVGGVMVYPQAPMQLVALIDMLERRRACGFADAHLEPPDDLEPAANG